MKNLAWGFFLVACLLWASIAAFPSFVQAEAPQQGVVNNRDTSVTNLPTAFGSVGAEVLASLSGKSNLAVINNTAGDLAVSTATTTANCSGGADNAIVPANGSSVFKGLFVNQRVCIRSLTGSAISTGTVRTMVW